MEMPYIIQIDIEKKEESKEKEAGLKLKNKVITAKEVTEVIESNLENLQKDEKNIEVCFSGDCFTNLEIEKQKEIFSSVLPYIKNGKISNVSISTMPQYISKENLKILKKYKVKNITLNVGTLNDYLLKRSKYSFTCEKIKLASKLIKRYGFNLVYKIYVGMPEATKLDEINTAKQICKLKPKKVEVYPVTVENQIEKYEPLTIIQSVERAKEITYILAKKKILVEIKGNNNLEFKNRVESGIWFDTIVEKIKQYNVKVKEVEIRVNSQDFEIALGYENENINKLKEYYNVDSKVITDEEVKPGKLEIIIKKKFTDFLEE